jgi:hypothetical protein
LYFFIHTGQPQSRFHEDAGRVLQEAQLSPSQRHHFLTTADPQDGQAQEDHLIDSSVLSCSRKIKCGGYSAYRSVRDAVSCEQEQKRSGGAAAGCSKLLSIPMPKMVVQKGEHPGEVVKPKKRNTKKGAFC